MGIKGGVPLTDFYADTNYPPEILEFFITPTRTFNSSKNYAVGPAVEFRLPLQLSLEMDGLYRPLTVTYEYGELTPPSSMMTTNSWEFSVLAKYRFRFRTLRPFVEAGPTFRLIGHFQNRFLSDDGAASGAGIDFRVFHMRLQPEIRYTYWTPDPRIAVAAHVASHHNQAEFLVSLLF